MAININNDMMNVNGFATTAISIYGKNYNNLIEANKVIYLPIDGKVQVVGFSTNGGTAIIARSVNGLPVTAVKNGRYFRSGYYPSLILAPADALLETWWGAYWHPYYEENGMLSVDYYDGTGHIVARNRTDDFWLKKGRLLHSVRSRAGDTVTIPDRTMCGPTEFDEEACMEFWEKYPSKVLCPARLASKAAEKFDWAEVVSD